MQTEDDSPLVLGDGVGLLVVHQEMEIAERAHGFCLTDQEILLGVGTAGLRRGINNDVGLVDDVVHPPPDIAGAAGGLGP